MARLFPLFASEIPRSTVLPISVGLEIWQYDFPYALSKISDSSEILPFNDLYEEALYFSAISFPSHIL